MADKEILAQIRDLEQRRAGDMVGILFANTPQTPACDHIDLAEALRLLRENFAECADLYEKAKLKGAKSLYIDPLRHAAAEIAKVADALRQPRRALYEVTAGPGPREAATTHERLDDLVSAAVAEGRGMLREVLSQPVVPPTPDQVAAGVTILRDKIANGEIYAQSSMAEVMELEEGADVAAYLSGEVDTLPGLTGALVPSSVTSVAEADDPFASDVDAELTQTLIDQQDEIMHATPRPYPLGNMLQVHADAVRAVDGPDALDRPMPKTWESDTMTADGHTKPGVAPTLGQPGDMGTGYDHAYVPPGGRRVTFAELLTPIPAASLPAHLSHSQGDTIGDCATKYRLQRVETLPQIPQWANIGGSAFHAAVEAFERTVAKRPARPVVAGETDGWKSYDCEGAWRHHFGQQISAVQATTTVPISVWRAARKGAEGRAWWEVNGPLMLRRYLDARPADVTWDPGAPAIELDLTVEVPTPYGPLPFNGKLDRVTINEDGRTLLIRDYKSSYGRPTDTTQLGDYAWILAFAYPDLAANGIKILGTYFDARRGEWTTPVDLLQAHPFEAFQYRVTTAHAQKRALTTGPTPARPSSFCGGCSVRYACPVMAKAPAS